MHLCFYKGELKRFGIKQGEDLTQENYEKIQNEVLLKRAKKRAMHLLEDMDRTESALRKKLRRDNIRRMQSAEQLNM